MGNKQSKKKNQEGTGKEKKSKEIYKKTKYERMPIVSNHCKGKDNWNISQFLYLNQREVVLGNTDKHRISLRNINLEEISCINTKQEITASYITKERIVLLLYDRDSSYSRCNVLIWESNKSPQISYISIEVKSMPSTIGFINDHQFVTLSEDCMMGIFIPLIHIYDIITHDVQEEHFKTVSHKKLEVYKDMEYIYGKYTDRPFVHWLGLTQNIPPDNLDIPFPINVAQPNNIPTSIYIGTNYIIETFNQTIDVTIRSSGLNGLRNHVKLKEKVQISEIVEIGNGFFVFADKLTNYIYGFDAKSHSLFSIAKGGIDVAKIQRNI